MKFRFVSLIFFLLLSRAVFCQSDLESTTLKKIGDDLPAFTTTSLKGESFSSSSLKGKVVLINFWATWCPPCKAELPVLQKNIFDKIKDANFSVLCISRGEKEDVVRKFIGQFKYTFPVYLDPDTKTYNLFASKYIPRNFVIGKDGKVKWSSVGFSQEEFDKMTALIKEELKK